MKYFWLVAAFAWLGTAAAVSVAVYVTGNPCCLVALYFPTQIRYRSVTNDNEDSKNDKVK